MGAEEHRKRAMKSVNCAVITVSDSRTEETDESGRKIIEILKSNNHVVKRHSLVSDDIQKIQSMLRECMEDEEISAIILNGGTGVSMRDDTIEAVESFSEKLLPGFGELFRMLSYEEIGAAAMLSRAIAFVSEEKAVFAIPGSVAAVELAVEKLIAPELGHLLSEVNR